MIGIINYGLGNVRAFSNVYKRLSIPHTLISSSDQFNKITKLILPGVGAFDHAMILLNQSGLRSTLEDMVISKHIPILGVCVGMQMLADGSEEGLKPGLSWIKGIVRKFDVELIQHQTQLPHMGWNRIYPKRKMSLFSHLDEEKRFYFLHSYYFECSDEKIKIAESDYAFRFTSAVNYKNIFGVQFHPEKSHNNGVQLLKNFAVMEVC